MKNVYKVLKAVKIKKEGNNSWLRTFPKEQFTFERNQLSPAYHKIKAYNRKHLLYKGTYVRLWL